MRLVEFDQSQGKGLREMTNVKINSLLENITLDVISLLFPEKTSNSKSRPLKYTNKRYLEEIFYVLKKGIG